MTIEYEMKSKPARQLWSDDRLADDSIILRLSFQMDWIYVTVLSGKTNKVTRRRYRHDQLVTIKDPVRMSA